ncbi:MAG: lipopolysaccharide biosynthesis protein, partial [Methyloprofundus sp.]|nr:lipopolysaccharide biosynthesis protein [Methyloprofundus sp.]
AYVQLKSEQRISGIELKNIFKQREKLEKSLEILEIRVSKTPQVERGYYNLMRDLDSHKQKYKELKAKSLDARLSQTLEEEQKAEKFALIEPARVPRKPVKPNRFKILMMGIALSIAVGFGLGYLAEMLDGSLRGHKALEKLTGVEPLVVIPYIKIQADIDKTRKHMRRLIIISSLLLIGTIAAVHFWYQPLDMIWFKLLNRLNMF